MAITIIPARTGTSVRLVRGETLRVIDPEGGQVCDLVAYAWGDITEWLSNGRSFDYGGKLYFTTGDVLYSNRSRPMLTIVADDVGCHDFLYTACSAEMYRIQYGATGDHPNCVDNLSRALAHHRVAPHLVPTPFNIFQNSTARADGRLVIAPPRSRAGDAIQLRAEIDLAIALSACSAPLVNGGSTKPIAYEILDA